MAKYLRKKAYTFVKHIDGVTTVKAKLSGFIDVDGIECNYGLKGLHYGWKIPIEKALKEGLIKEVKQKQ